MNTCLLYYIASGPFGERFKHILKGVPSARDSAFLLIKGLPICDGGTNGLVWDFPRLCDSQF